MFPVRNVVWKPTVFDCVPVSDPKGLLSQWSKSLGCVPSTYMPGSCSVLTLPCCLCSSLAFGWTVVHQSRPCRTSGARKHLQVSQIQAPAILSLNLNINLGVMLPKEVISDSPASEPVRSQSRMVMSPESQLLRTLRWED